MASPNHSIKKEGSYKQLISLAAPIMLGILINQINFATNTYFLDKYGTNELAANGVASIYYMVFTMMIVGLCSGVQILLSRRAGEENRTAIGEIISAALKIGLLLSTLSVLVSLLFAPTLFKQQLHNPDLQALATTFITVRIWGLPFFFLQQLFVQFLISIGKSQYILLCMLLATAVNILGDYALIFGKFGFPALGIQGAAIASIASEVAFVLLAAIIFIVHRYGNIYFIKFFRTFDKKLSIAILKVAAPVMMQYFFSIASWELFYIYVEHLGAQELAISQILRSVFGTAGASSWALASSCNATVSNVIGQGRLQDVTTVVKRSAILSVSIATIAGLALFLFRTQFLGIYTNNVALQSAALAPLIVVIISNILLAAGTVVFNAVAGTGNTTVSMSIEFAAVTVYIVYIYLVIERARMNLSWAWGSEFVYWFFLLIVSATYLKFGNWQKRKI
jgi:multidrug resistance protein, MATE family